MANTLDTKINSPTDKDLKDSEGIIYKTTFKKGHMISEFYWKGPQGLNEAIAKAKAYLSEHYLNHIHTVPWLIDINAPATEQGIAPRFE